MLDSAKSSYFNAKIADAEQNSKVMIKIMNEILANNQDSKLPSLPASDENLQRAAVWNPCQPG